MERDQLAEAALRGDEDALLKRIQVDKRQMYAIAYSYMRSESDALEAIQETVCRVWLKRKSLRDPKLFSTWMMRILIRVCIDEKRKRKREMIVEWPNSFYDKSAEAEDRMQQHSTERLDMTMMLQQLPPEQRMVVTLKYYRDMTLTEIAALMGKPEGSIKTWLHKALKRMRKQMAATNPEMVAEVNRLET
ncbi:sigma-70 family RNA polymerase sigma factor [Paenibacillus protaetiae]|uniref:Sigma-70 family RNA polymerase sigma factor n=1 Tax=Paenibacillus protaetiae TaxID=2509456 RepID=A0A4V0YFD6_9BACL|nr:sigma-70 family RNA polymerase sigma factor [Paenibacillus protaetiae]QAY67341.1 sigma-70 family RNA polymerase sigma factor [Paenibacillus protaetiae]